MLTLAPKKRSNKNAHRRHSETHGRRASPRPHNITILSIKARRLEVDVVSKPREQVERVAPACVRGTGDLVWSQYETVKTGVC